MAELWECPGCGEILNLELRDAVVDGVFGSTIIYKCQKCGVLFTEDLEVFERVDTP